MEQLLDALFDHIDDLLLQFKFTEVDTYLETLDIETISAVELLTILTACLPAQKYLKHYAAFYIKANTILVARGYLDMIRLFTGLEPMNEENEIEGD